jgi:hypothetical protein
MKSNPTLTLPMPSTSNDSILTSLWTAMSLSQHVGIQPFDFMSLSAAAAGSSAGGSNEYFGMVSEENWLDVEDLLKLFEEF